MRGLGILQRVRRLERHGEELISLREELANPRKDMNILGEDMMRSFEIMKRHISALGAR